MEKAQLEKIGRICRAATESFDELPSKVRRVTPSVVVVAVLRAPPAARGTRPPPRAASVSHRRRDAVMGRSAESHDRRATDARPTHAAPSQRERQRVSFLPSFVVPSRSLLVDA